jgi:hypothetical protein
MATCQRCAAINFDDRCWYALGSVGFMMKSALSGCPGCKFFLAVTRPTDDDAQDADGDNDLHTNENACQDPDSDADESVEDSTEESFIVERRPELQVLLQRYSLDSNRVDLNFMKEGAEVEVVSYEQLRLCTAYGK